MDCAYVGSVQIVQVMVADMRVTSGLGLCRGVQLRCDLGAISKCLLSCRWKQFPFPDFPTRLDCLSALLIRRAISWDDSRPVRSHGKEGWREGVTEGVCLRVGGVGGWGSAVTSFLLCVQLASDERARRAVKNV